MKTFFTILMLVLLCSLSFAGETEMPCVAGYCEGWKIYYDRDTTRIDIMKFKAYNNTGVTAFQVQLIVNCYDYMDHYLGRANCSTPGPIHKYAGCSRAVPKNTSKMDAEIYWTDNYYSEDKQGPTLGE